MSPARGLSPITVRRYGTSGPLVYVLHGGPGAPGSAAGLARALGTGFRVREPLQRRSGEVPMTVAQHVADLDAVIDEETLLVGWSWGAMLALSYAVVHLERVRGIALVGCGTYDPKSREHYQRAMEERQTAEQREEIGRLQEALNTAGGAERDALFTELGAIAGRVQSVDLVAEEEASVPADARGFEETWRDVTRLQREGIEPQSFATIDVPTILIQGDRDPHPGRLIYARLHECVPQLTFEEIENCGHEPWRERGAREPFLDTLTSWLRDRSRRPEK